MTDPFKHYRSIAQAAKQAQQIHEQFMQSSAYLVSQRSGFTQAMREIQRQHELLGTHKQVIAQIQAAQDVSNRLMLDDHSSIISLLEQADRWKSLTEPAIRQLQDLKPISSHMTSLAGSFVTWESSTTRLAQRVQEIGLIAQRTNLSARLFAPSEAFTTFAQHTLERIESAKNEHQIWAFETSLQLAEEQLIANTEILEEIVTTPEDKDEVSESRELATPYLQQEELLNAAEKVDDEDAATLINTSPAVRAVDLSRNVLTTISKCNEARKISGGEEIFKPTTKLLEVYADLPWLMPVDKNSFAQFIDCLYFLFYEGAGKDKLRFLKSNGGPIVDEDFNFILCVKHLRNKWTRHDSDHGKDAAIRKAWNELSTKFRSLGLQHMPVTEDHFRLLHINLLFMAYEFAEKILSGIIEDE